MEMEKQGWENWYDCVIIQGPGSLNSWGTIRDRGPLKKEDSALPRAVVPHCQAPEPQRSVFSSVVQHPHTARHKMSIGLMLQCYQRLSQKNMPLPFLFKIILLMRHQKKNAAWIPTSFDNSPKSRKLKVGTFKDSTKQLAEISDRRSTEWVLMWSVPDFLLIRGKTLEETSRGAFDQQHLKSKDSRETK